MTRIKSNKLLNERQTMRLLGKKDLCGLAPDVVIKGKGGKVELFFHPAEVMRHKVKLRMPL